MIYNMLLYLGNSGSNQRKTKTTLIDCSLSLKLSLIILNMSSNCPKSFYNAQFSELIFIHVRVFTI